MRAFISNSFSFACFSFLFVINLFNYTFEVAKSAMSLGLLVRQKHLGVLWARRRLHEILWILFGSMMLIGSRQK